MTPDEALPQAVANQKFGFVLECGLKIGRDENGCPLIVFANKDKQKIRRFPSFSATLTDLDLNLTEDLVKSEKEEWHLPKDGHFDIVVNKFDQRKFFGFVKRDLSYKVIFGFKPS